MNFQTFERGQVAAFAYNQAKRTGSVDCMKAVCYVIRNRVRAGWGDGTWLSIIQSHPAVSGNAIVEMELNAKDRLLQMIVRDIDDIYLGNSGDDTKVVVQDSLYYQFIDQPVNPWFVENIVRKPIDHPRIGHVGPIALFK